MQKRISAQPKRVDIKLVFATIIATIKVLPAIGFAERHVTTDHQGTGTLRLRQIKQDAVRSLPGLAHILLVEIDSVA